jgi:hypothetical protein
MRFGPKSLRGKLTWTLILGLLGIVLVALTLSSIVLYDSARGRWAQPIAERVALTIQILDSADEDDDRFAVIRALRANGIIVRPMSEPPDWMVDGTNAFAPVEERLRVLLPEDTEIAIAPRRHSEHGLTVFARTEDLAPVEITFRGVPPNPRLFISLLVMVLAAVLGIVLLAIWVARRVTRPLTGFAQAADQLGAEAKGDPMPEKGPTEIATAARAFNRMRERIQRFVADRMHLIAAAGHDLRTPITRLRLRAEFVEDEDLQTKLLRDLDEMERLIDDTIALVREETAEEPPEAVDLADLVADVVADRAHLDPAPVLGTVDRPMRVAGRPMALKRALGNLVDNALRHGGDATIALAAGENEARITVTDHGPGIPEEALEAVFEPFVRVEASRSRNTGGSGLGLAIARAILRAEGGSVRLANRPQGGLVQTVTLPLGGTGR